VKPKVEVNLPILYADDRIVIFQTADGSPTAAFREAQGPTEFMHNTLGAFTESIYNYGTALELAQNNNNNPLHILSVGLGLGYNECIAASQTLLKPARRRTEEISLTSFESQSFLVENFLAWLEELPRGVLWPQVYGQILKYCSQYYKIPESRIKDRLLNWRQQDRWKINGSLNEAFLHRQKYNVIFFDAYSSHSSPELWSSSLLEPLLKQHCTEACVFSTYACRGELKRLLKNQGFQILRRPGFGEKRESTLALRSPSIDLPFTLPVAPTDASLAAPVPLQHTTKV
jgi:tRNA U34 5-methylaminomethyl-2-thiouridine-forming methyltransferase MnmC